MHKSINIPCKRAKVRYEKRKAEKQEFTTEKKARLLAPEEQAADEECKAKRRVGQKAWREKKKASSLRQSRDSWDMAPMVYVNDKLYQIVDNPPNLTDSDLILLGEIGSKIPSS